jgi:hypothetical protein
MTAHATNGAVDKMMRKYDSLEAMKADEYRE